MQNSFIERKLATWLLRQTSTSGLRRVASVGGAIASEIGNVRDENQDRSVIVRGVDSDGESYALAIVTDGIGGMLDGKQCAALGVASFVSQFCSFSRQGVGRVLDRFNRSIHAANKSVFNSYQGKGGTTFVALLVCERKGTYWGSAGDSRIYGFPGRRLQQITIDDTIAGQLGKNRPAPAEHNKILQFVGMGSDFDPHVNELSEDYGDLFLLTTDGVHNLADNDDIFNRILQNSTHAGMAAKRLVDLAKWCGGVDNATIAIITNSLYFSEASVEEDDCISVWDAFGELQIQLSEMQMGYQRGDEDDPIPNNRNDNPNEEIEVDIPLESPEQAEYSSNKNQSRSKKRNQKRKQKKREGDDLVESDAPQLNIEFSSKSE